MINICASEKVEVEVFGSFISKKGRQSMIKL